MSLHRGFRQYSKADQANAGVKSLSVGGELSSRQKHTFNGRVVLVHEMTLNQLDGQARFTNTTATNDDELVLSQELFNFWKAPC